MKKRVTNAMALLLTGLILVSCVSSPPPESSTDQALSDTPEASAVQEETTVPPAQSEADPRPGTVIWSTAQSLASADAHMWDVVGDLQIHYLALEGLIEHVGWNEFEPALATSWDVSSDYLTYTFYLREGVTFHSGDPFTAEDVVWSAERMKNMPAGSASAQLSSLEEIKAIDEMTVELKFSEPNPMLFFNLAHLRVYSKAQAERDGENFFESFNGTGPWKLQVWKPGERIRFERNNEWWGTFAEGAPQEVEHRPIPEEATRLAALLSGEIDLVPNVPAESKIQIEATDYLFVESMPGLNCVALIMRNDTPPFNNTSMRQAMDLLIPREDIVNELLGGQGTPANVWSQPAYSWYPSELEGVVKSFDMDQAKELIEQSGYNGEEIRLMTRRGRSERDVEICEFLANIWTQAGLNVTVEVVADAAFAERRSAGDFEVYMTAWDINSPGYYYRDRFAAHNINRAMVDPTFVELVDRINSEAERSKFDQCVMELERYLFEDPATLNLYWQQNTFGVSRRLQSFEPVGGMVVLRMHNFVLEPSAR